MAQSQMEVSSAPQAAAATTIGWSLPQRPVRVRLETVAEAAPRMVDIGRVLTAWRAADRALTEIPEASPEWTRVHTHLLYLRDSYHRLFEQRSRERATY